MKPFLRSMHSPLWSVGLCLTLLPLWAQDASSPPPAVLTNASQVRMLKQEDAARGLPVLLRGVVISEAEPEGHGFVIWDGDQSIYLRGTNTIVSLLNRGDIVEVGGYTDPGGFAPFVQMTNLYKLGQGQIPPPQPVTFEQLLASHLDAQWVQISGIVRSCEPLPEEEDKTKLILATGGGKLTVQINTNLSASQFVDAQVSLRGICFNQHNMARQFLSPLLLVPRGVNVTVEETAPADPFSAERRSVGSLLQFAPQGAYGHRVLVRGIVTHRRGEYFWIRDGDRGLRVQSRQQERLHVGDEVDVLGFPDRGDYTPILQDAVFQKRASRKMTPIPVPVTNILTALTHDADLVELTTRLSEMRPAQDGLAMTLEWENSAIKALLYLPKGFAPPDWRVGSLVRVVGICVVVPIEAGPVSGVWEPHSFQLLLRSPADLAVLQAPSWWTHEHQLWAFGIIAAASLLAVAAVVLAARHRLREQSSRRATAEAEFAAILRERNRMAREIHDTLAQGLGAISVQLELAKSGVNGAENSLSHHLETAHRLVRSSLADARTSIWNMRSQVLETNDVAGALKDILHQFTDGTDVKARLKVTGPSRRMPPVIENDLLRIGQEAITNAAQHAKARNIEVKLDFAPGQIRLVVKDDGIGFDTGRPAAGEGHFGLVGMKERAAQLRGDLRIESVAGKGTTVSLGLPVPE